MTHTIPRSEAPAPTGTPHRFATRVVRTPLLERATLYRAGRVAAIGCLILGLTGCVTPLTVSRSSGSSINNATTDNILGDFSAVILTADSGTDFACATDFGPDYDPALYLREGNVTVNAGPDVINSQADFNDVIGEPGYGKVVTEINWCGGLAPNIIGCAPVPGDSFAVVRFTESQEGILWAHEFGHTVGLSHTSGANRVMRGTINSANDEITSSECLSFVSKYDPDWPNGPEFADPQARRAMLSAMGHELPVATVPGGIDGNIAADGDDDIVTFVRRVYIHGTPMLAALRFRGTDAAPTLSRMLADPAEQPYWGNIAAVLGVVGDRDTAQVLIDFVAARSAVGNDGAERRMVTAALMGLGYLASHIDDRAPLDFLLRATDPAFWGDGTVSAQMATAAYLGLALSGRPAARNALASQRGDRLSGAMADELVGVTDTVASLGLEGYYSGIAE
jgi:hypothetical protein